MDKKTRELHDLFSSITSDARTSAPGEFEAPKGAKQDAKDLSAQKYDHRDTLLKLVGRLSVASFTLLAVVTLAQMIIRIWNKDYNGTSDVALNILAVSVFGQVIAVVGTIAYNVWKEPKS